MSLAWTHLRKPLGFALLLVAILFALVTLNWLGSVLNPQSVRRFATIEELASEVRPARVFRPAYYPEEFEWPPFEILAKTGPHLEAVFHVRDRTTHRLVLGIRQADSAIAKPVPLRIFLVDSRSSEQVDLGDRLVEVTQGKCGENPICYQVSWEEGNYRLTLVGTRSRSEILRIASGMRSE